MPLFARLQLASPPAYTRRMVKRLAWIAVAGLALLTIAACSKKEEKKPAEEDLQMQLEQSAPAVEAHA